MPELLSVPFQDTQARDLVWTLENPPLPALAGRVVPRPGIELELRILGASHQAVLGQAGAARTGAPALVETVACLPGVPGALPEHCTRRVPGYGTYRIRTRVDAMAPGALSGQVRWLRRRVAAPDGIIAAFPGDPLAVTAVLVESPGDPARLRWRSWHAYPQTGELVRTESTLSLTHCGSEDQEDSR